MARKQTVGIPFARDSNGHRYGRQAIDRQPQPFTKPLYCDGCGTRVRAVPTHTITLAEGNGLRASYYGLVGGGEHRPGCVYDFDRQAHRLVTESRGRVDRRGEHYRLLLPDDADISHPAPGDRGRPRANTRLRTTVRRADHTLLGEAVANAQKIARLLRHFEHDPAAVDRFQADYHGRRITWPQFFYPADRIGDLVGRLVAGGLRHPIAVGGARHRAGPASSGSSYFISDRPQQIRLGTHQLRVEVTLRTSDRSVYADLDRAATWVALGWWKLYPPSPQQPRWLQLWIDGTWNYSIDI